jgi:nicotinamide-nucleotide amidase
VSGDVAIVVVGDEILQGRRMEANAAWLARELFAMGVPLAEVRIVSDTPGTLVAAIAQLRKAGRLVVCTGGLGPTRDDRTRAEAAEAFGRKLVRSEEALSQVAERYARIARPLDEASYRQADIPEGARVVPNPAGTAPAFLLESDGFRLICLPGVPREMRAIFDQSLRAELAPLADPPGIARLFTHGLGESEQESRMRELDLGEAEFCSLPGAFGVEIQVLARGPSEDRQPRAEALLGEVAAHLGEGVIHPPGTTLRQALLSGLRERGWKLAFAESCTAGLAAAEFAAEPGVSDVLWGGVVAYSNDLKRALLAVSEQTISVHGAVSRETALEMARGAAILAGESGLGLSVTGVAGPSGGTPEKPVGLVWIAASGPAGEVAEELRLPGTRDEIRQRAAWRLIGLGWKMVRPA